MANPRHHPEIHWLKMPSDEHGCQHWNPELTRRTRKNGSFVLLMQCGECGEPMTHPIQRRVSDDLVAGGEEIKPFDEKLFDQGRAIARERRLEQRGQEHQKWLEEHDAYLASAEWGVLRGKVLKRCGGVCEGCGDTPASQVHHLTYDHWRNELLFELVGLCARCHERAHADRSTSDDNHR